MVFLSSFQNHWYYLSLLAPEILQRILVSLDGVILSGARHALSIYCRIQERVLATFLGRDLGYDLDLVLYMRVLFLAAV